MSKNVSAADEEAVRKVLGQLGQTESMKETAFACRQISGVLRGELDDPTQRLIEQHGMRLADALCAVLHRPRPSSETDSESKWSGMLLEAVAALRNLCVVGGVLLCSQAAEKGRAVEWAVSTLRAVLAGGGTATDEVLSLSTQGLLLLDELVENVESAVSAVTRSGFACEVVAALTMGWPTVKGSVLGSETRLAMSRFAATVTDDNSELSSMLIARFGSAETLLAALTANPSVGSDDPEVRALLPGVAFNVFGGGAGEDACVAAVAPDLKEILVPDCFDGVRECGDVTVGESNGVGSTAEEEAESEIVVEASAEEQAESEISVESAASGPLALWKKKAMAQQTALEVLVNICFGGGCGSARGPAADSPEDDEMAVDTSEHVEEEGGSQDDARMAPQDSDASSEQTQKRLKALSSSGVLGQVVAKAFPRSIDEPEKFVSAHPGTASHVAVARLVQSRALSCLNNLILCSGTNVEGLPSSPDLWAKLDAALSSLLPLTVSSTGDDADTRCPLRAASAEALEECASCMESFARSVASLPSTAWTPSIGGILKVFSQSCSDATLLHAAGAVATAARIGGNRSDAEQESVATALLGLSMDEAADIEVIGAAIDGLIDVFAEAPERPSLRTLHKRLYASLEQVLPAFKRRVLQAKKKLDPDQFDQLNDVRVNLARLLKYKAAQKLD